MNNNSLNILGQLRLMETRGYSAYEVAQLNGYTGTEQEWLESLVGPVGPQGPQGKSAYQVAVDNGYQGTEEEWIDSFLTPDGYYDKEEVDEKFKIRPCEFDNINDMKENNLKIGNYVVVDKSKYKIIDTKDAIEVDMIFNTNKSRYELLGNSNQQNIPSILNPVNFEDLYPSGIYKTSINDKTYIFELNESLKSINDSRDIFWIDTNNEIMGLDKNINEIILNGSEGWEEIDNSEYSENILRFRTTSFLNVFNSSDRIIYISSNILEGVQLKTRNKNGIAVQMDAKGINIFIDKSNLETANVQGLVKFLNENKAIVRYRNLITDSFKYNDITLNNGLLAKQIEENYIFPQKSILDYKDYVIGNDWLPAFNQALSENIKSLYIPTGIYIISDTFTINNGMKIYGDGIDNSIIKMVTFNEDATSVIEFNYSHNSFLRDLTICSITDSISLLGGLYIHFSNYVHIDNVKIEDINGDGLFAIFDGKGKTSYDCKLTNLEVHTCTGNGFHLSATDLFLVNCIAHNVKKHGFLFEKSNSLLLNCKAYWTGKEGDETTGDGFYLKTDDFTQSLPEKIGHKTRMINCEAQECGRHGFTLINTDSCQLIGCQSDTNGMFCENIISYGYYLQNNRNLKLIGTIINQNLVGWIKIPLYFNGGNCNNIDLKIQVLEYGKTYYKFFDDLYTILNYNPSNEIYINNYQINKPDYQNTLYEYNNTSGVVTDFIFLQAGTPIGSSQIDFDNKSQKLVLEYIAGATVNSNAKIYKDFNVLYTNFNKISMSVLTKQENQYAKSYIRFRFYDSDNSQIEFVDSSIPLYNDDRKEKPLHWNVLTLDSLIPQNTVKVRVEIFTALQNSGIEAETGGCSWFKDFKLCCYNQ